MTVDLGPRAPTGEEGDGEGRTERIDPMDAGDGDDPSYDGGLPAVEADATRTIGQPAEVHNLPTQQLVGRPSRAPTGAASLSRMSASATTASPIEAMRFDELERTRIFLKVIFAVCVGGIIVALTAQGDPVARNVVLVGTGGALVGIGWMLLVTRNAATWDNKKFLFPALAIVFGSMAGVYYWGTASPVAAMLVYGIYFFSLSSNVRLTTSIYLLIAITHGALGLGIVSGVLEDRGLVNMGGLRTLDQISIVCIIEFLYFITFFTARVSQRVTLDAMTKLDQAARTVAQRDALLAEARAELDRALKVGGPGRFSEQVIGGFRLGILIGRGGMGEVYEAHGVTDHREAAVKLLHPGTLADPTHVQRFIREAQIASQLDCANVVRVLEVGTTAGEVPFLAMERLRGHDLAHQLRRHRKLQLPQVRAFVEQVALGLEAARLAGIVHRDLKPHNVFLAELAGARQWKILDFGVSKSNSSGTLTKGHIIGTPAYMAPEQARGEDVDHRADVYSLAAILYRSVTGHPAFTGKDVPSMLYDVVYRVPTQPSILATVPADIDRVLAIGLAKSPADRFATAIELARWFAASIEGQLDPEQRKRADDVIAKYPWGTRPGISTSS